MNGCPGIGGSLGQCAFCGDPFLKEILMGESIPTFQIGQVQGDLYAHRACLEKYEKCESILEWPDKSPVRLAILAHNSKIDTNATEDQKQI